MSYRITQFGSTLLPNLEESHDIGGGASRLQIIDVADGQYDLEGPTEISKRAKLSLAVQGTLFGATPTAVQTQLDALKVLRGTQAKLYRLLPSGVTQWAWARLDSLTGVHGSRMSRYIQITANFVVISQAWNGVGHSYSFYDIGSLIDVTTLPRTGALAAGAGATTLTGVNNSGTLNQHLMTITVTAAGGAVTAFDLVNNTTGHTIGWDGTLADGHALVIDTNDLSVENDGTGEYALLAPHLAATKEHWFELAPGDNSLTATVTGGPATVEFVFYGAHA